MTIYENTALWRQTREQLFLDGAPQSLGELLSEAAHKYGDTLAVDLFDRGQKLRFKEWDVKASKLAGGFQSVGIRQGMHVGVGAYGGGFGADKPKLHAN